MHGTWSIVTALAQSTQPTVTDMNHWSPAAVKELLTWLLVFAIPTAIGLLALYRGNRADTKAAVLGDKVQGLARGTATVAELVDKSPATGSVPEAAKAAINLAATNQQGGQGTSDSPNTTPPPFIK